MKIIGGTAGWSYPDWYGPFYPKKLEKGFSELKFYADFFDCVEVNSTFYRHFPPTTAEKWLFEVKKNPEFEFIIKLNQVFTHGSRQKDQEFLDNRSVVMEFLAPLVEQKKLGGLLVQFSEYYRESDETRGYLEFIMDMFHEYQLFFELRHTSWYAERGREFFRRTNASIVAIDQPQLKGMVPFDPEIMGQAGYVRFHGRNAAAWQAGRESLREGKKNSEEDRNARYNYLYSSSELDELEQMLRKVMAHCESTYLIMNNHPLGRAVVNALELVRRMRDLERIKVPDTVLKYFPEIGKFAERINVSPLTDLFGE